MAMILGSSIANQQSLVRLMHSHIISSHSAPEEEVVVAAIQADFNLDLLTSYLLVIFDKLHSLTEKDVLIQSVMKFTKYRWSDLTLLRQHRDWSQRKRFYRRRESLTIDKGCILFWERVVIQTALRTKVLKLLHQGHTEIQRIKSLARNYE